MRTGPDSFAGSCTPCHLTFAGKSGAHELYLHRMEVHPPNTWERESRKPYSLPNWVCTKATPWGRVPTPMVPNPNTPRGWAYLDAMESVEGVLS